MDLDEEILQRPTLADGGPHGVSAGNIGPTTESDFVEKQVVFSFCGGVRPAKAGMAHGPIH